MFRRRRLIFLAAVAVAICAAGIVSAGPIVRARVRAEGARRRLDVEVGSIRVGWFSVSLRNLTIRPRGWAAVSAHVSALRIPLTVWFRPAALEVSGGTITVHGSPAEVARGADEWKRGLPSGSGSSGQTLPISFEGMAVEWKRDGLPFVEAWGLQGQRDAHGTKAKVAAAGFRIAGRLATLSEAAVELGRQSRLVTAKVASVSVVAADQGGKASPSPAEPSAPEASEPEPSATITEDAGKPILDLPDLRRVRVLAAEVVGRIGDKVPVGAQMGVDALTFQLGGERRGGGLTVGPGAFSITRAEKAFDVSFVMGRREEMAPLSFSAVVPTDAGDLTVRLRGGPVSFSALGVKEGEWGLVETERATLAGRVEVALAGDGSSLSFDADGSALGVSIHEPRLAPEVVRGLDLSLRARGVTSGGQLRVDDFAAELGAIRVSASGALDQAPDHVEGSLHMQIAPARCQTLVDSFPPSLLPVIQGAKVAGTFGATGQLAFDTRSLDDLRLDYEVHDECRTTEVPEPLSREHFQQPFMHRIYLPDGSQAERPTGPGTNDWVPLDSVSPFMEVAVLTTEDGAFFRHHGFNRSAIRASLIANLKARRFVRGASTITMQLAKNLFLTREKTLSRKLEEVMLTEYLEQAFSKDELLELYFNVIEFGPGIYGIGAAADHYFGRSPAELNMAECLFLSSLLPAPIRYSRMHDGERAPDGWMKTLQTLMRVAYKRGLITDAELAEGQSEQVVFWHPNEDRPPPRPPLAVRVRFDKDEAGDAFDPPSLVP